MKLIGIDVTCKSLFNQCQTGCFDCVVVYVVYQIYRSLILDQNKVLSKKAAALGLAAERRTTRRQGYGIFDP
jgi:hypothetical protein